MWAKNFFGSKKFLGKKKFKVKKSSPKIFNIMWELKFKISCNSVGQKWSYGVCLRESRVERVELRVVLVKINEMALKVPSQKLSRRPQIKKIGPLYFLELLKLKKVK